MKNLIAICLIGIASIAYAEEYDVDSETGFRMERYRGPVPTSVPGAKTVDTDFVVEAINDSGITLIDVYPPKGLGPDPISGEWLTPEIRETIAGATWLPDVGRGFLEPELEDYFKRNLESITQGDKTKPILFFCTSDCWQSWNASIRANQWGYTNVHWYPTGSDGWQEQGGEVIEVAPVNFLDTVSVSGGNGNASGSSSSSSGSGSGSGSNNSGNGGESSNGNDNNKAGKTTLIFPSRAEIFLLDKNNKELNIGTVDFIHNQGDQYGIAVNVESESFNDHFLSMRPFKCLDGAKEWFCHQPYLYDLDNVVTEDDLSDLEYQLLFIKKTPQEFGIDAWNGLYFRFEKMVNNVWTANLLEGDLNVLQSPPEPGTKPIELNEFIEADTDQRRYIKLELRPSS